VLGEKYYVQARKRMLTRECPCCHKKITLLEFFKGMPNPQENKYENVVCIKCGSSLILRKAYTKYMLSYVLVFILLLFLIMVIKELSSHENYLYHVTLLGLLYGVHAIGLILYMFHKSVSRNYICKDGV